MSELATIARPYANALYDVSEENSLNFSSTLESLLGIVSDKDFVVYSNNPSTSNKVITKFLTEIVDEKNLEFVNFVKVLTENSRLGFGFSIKSSSTLNVSLVNNGSPPVILKCFRSLLTSGHHFQNAST